ncbi:hypothetical protein MUP77_12015 [Candidatus Bathyarchaeota archaeon]|nr:hypothetical protein [Candidatus Bathyarchaeota archaeon]
MLVKLVTFGERVAFHIDLPLFCKSDRTHSFPPLCYVSESALVSPARTPKYFSSARSNLVDPKFFLDVE